MKDLRILHIPNECTGCGACSSICPKRCIEMKPDRDGFYYPVVDLDNCIECNSCEKACHIVNPQEETPITRSDFYVYKTEDNILRRESTSGGAFSLFADYVLSQGGVVFGSRYNGEKERLEVCDTEVCGLEPLRKSKYIESFVGNSFTHIRKALKDGRWVLYCGSPCQAAGLRQFIRQTKTSEERLIIIDFACHGVPSNKFFTDFKRRFESRGRKLVDAEFRVKDPNDPRTGWHIQTLRLTFSDGTKRVLRRNSSYYYYHHPFDVSCSLRRSCYDCHQVDCSEADITIGDFWDIKDYPSVKDDNKGYSFIKIHKKGLVPLFLQISTGDFVEKLPDNLIQAPYNKGSKHRLLVNREKFISLTRKYPYYKAVRKYFGVKHLFNALVVRNIKTSVKRVIAG